MSFNLKNCARITFKHILLGHLSNLTQILNDCSQRDRVGKCQRLKSDKNKAETMQNSLLKSFFLNIFFEDKGQFASDDWNFLCQGCI